MSSLLAIEGPAERLIINADTFDFIWSARNLLGKFDKELVNEEDKKTAYTEFLKSFEGYFPAITQDLERIDPNFSGKGVDCTLDDLRSLLCKKSLIVQNSYRTLELGQSFTTNRIKVCSVGPVSPNSISIMSSPLFKVSCAATTTGVVTYCALRLYNKDKTKEQRYSPIKWSVGAAGIVGLGTYCWCVR